MLSTKVAVEMYKNASCKYRLTIFYAQLQIDEVMSDGYRPSTEDILKTRIVTSGISEIHFTIGVSILSKISQTTQR